MALSNAEKQRRYRARHVMVPRDTHPAIALVPPAVSATPRADLDLTEVHAALAEARHVLRNRYPHLPVLCQQVQMLMTVLERLVEALEGPRGVARFVHAPGCDAAVWRHAVQGGVPKLPLPRFWTGPPSTRMY